jgi:hypothetical protein
MSTGNDDALPPDLEAFLAEYPDPSRPTPSLLCFAEVAEGRGLDSARRLPPLDRATLGGAFGCQDRGRYVEMRFCRRHWESLREFVRKGRLGSLTLVPPTDLN